MKTLKLFFLLIFGSSLGQVPNGDFSSGTLGWNIGPATFSISAPSGYLQVNKSGTFTEIFYLKSANFSVPPGNFSVHYSYINARFDPMMGGSQPMGGPAVRLKDSAGNIIADFTTVSGSCSNESQNYGSPPTNTCTTDPIAVNVAGSYYLEFSTFSNYLHWFVMDNILTSSGVLSVKDSGVEKSLIYPNPANDRIFINNIENIKEVKIYNSEGRLLKNISTNSTSIDVSSLEKGIYYVEILTLNKIHKTRFIKE